MTVEARPYTQEEIGKLAALDRVARLYAEANDHIKNGNTTETAFSYSQAEATSNCRFNVKYSPTLAFGLYLTREGLIRGLAQMGLGIFALDIISKYEHS